MAFEGLADRLAGRSVPDPRGLVIRRGDDALAVRAERRARHQPHMPLSGSPIGLPSRRPRPRRPVPRRGDDALAVGAERRAVTRILMAQNELLAEITPGAIELQLRLGNIRPIVPARCPATPRAQAGPRFRGRPPLLARLLRQEQRLWIAH